MIISEIMCASPDLIANGDFYPKKTLYYNGEEVNFSCKLGYALVGNTTTSCKIDGTWTKFPFCKCKSLEKI